MHPSAQLEDPEPPMPRHELPERQVHNLTLRPRTSQPLGFGNDLVIDLDVGAHTHDHTHA